MIVSISECVIIDEFGHISEVKKTCETVTNMEVKERRLVKINTKIAEVALYRQTTEIPYI